MRPRPRDRCPRSCRWRSGGGCRGWFSCASNDAPDGGRSWARKPALLRARGGRRIFEESDRFFGSSAKQPVEAAPFVRIQPRVPERFLPAPIGFEVVLDENADAMRSAAAAADGIDAVGIAEDDVPCL